MFRSFLFLALCVSAHAGSQVFQAFEGDGFDDWKIEGGAFGMAPVVEKTAEMKEAFVGFCGESLAVSAHGGAATTGKLISATFEIKEPYIAFFIAGGDMVGKTAAQLIIDGKVVREATGNRSLRAKEATWNVSELVGKTAHIELVDDDSGEWGFIGVDHIVFLDGPDFGFPPTTRGGKKLLVGLAPSSDFPTIDIPTGSSLKLEANFEKQQLNSPTALTFDDKGSIYVAESHRFGTGGIYDDRAHLYWYLDDIASKTTADRRAMHEKWQKDVPIEEMTKHSEIIRRLSDTDGDGAIDESKVFADNFKDLLDGTAAGVFHYEGTLFFACIPKLYALRDTDGDGTADERKVIQDGFGVRVSLSGHDANGFTLGPDGRIYGTIGDRGLNCVTKEGVAFNYPNEGGAFRFEADGTGFELFHTGLRNPKELSFDELGNPFTVDNNSDQGDKARIVYLVEGADSGWQMEHQGMHSFHRQIGLEERPTSRWMDERMWELENPSQPAYLLPPSALLTSGPSGLTSHPGAGFLQSEKGRFLICDFRGGAANSGIWSFQMEPKGAGMAIADSRQFIWGMAATDIEYSWDGRLFVTDWVAGWKSHDAGNLYSLKAKDATFLAPQVADGAKIVREGFNQRPSQELVSLLSHPDSRIRIRAQIALTRKPDAIERFSEAVASADFYTRLHGIWGFGILSRRGSMPSTTGEFSNLQGPEIRTSAQEKLVSLLTDADAEIRAQVLKTLADSPAPAKPIAIAPYLADASPRVRFFAAILVGKHKNAAALNAVCDMLAANNGSDVYLRHAGAFALSHLATDSKPLTALTTHPSVAVRLAATVALRRMASPEVAAFISDPDPKVQDEVIIAVTDLDLKAARPAIATCLDALDKRSWAPFMLKRLIHNSFRLGDSENAARLLTFAANVKNPEGERKEALRLISVWVTPPPVDQLTAHYNPLSPRDPATLMPSLTAGLPTLIKQEGFALTAALGLISQYKLEIADLDDATLQKIVNNPKLQASARANALTLFVKRRPAGLEALLTTVASDASDELAISALTNLAEISPAAAIPTLASLMQGSPSPRTQKAWAILASLPGDEVDGIFVSNIEKLQASSGVAVHAIELLAAARIRNSAPITVALKSYDEAIAKSTDPLAQWNTSLEGGDATVGAALFKAHPTGECMRCHRAEEGHTAGGETAPNLLGVAARHKDRRYFLESMITPSKVIAAGFGAVLVDFKNGASITGMLLDDATDHLDITAEGKPRRISRSDVASVTPPASPMPPMAQLLNATDLRDLVAWLASLTTGDVSPVAAAAPELLDPSTLKVPEKSAAVAGIDPAFLKTGQQQFIVCGACHGQAGEGTAAGPPLAGSEWVNGPAENLIRIQLRGLQGPIKVKGVEYNFPAGMSALSFQTDEQIAAVLTYVRSSLGNTAAAVSPAEVAALRSEVGKPQLKASELILPVTASITPAAGGTAATAAMVSTKYNNLPREISSNKWMAIAFGGAVGLLTLLMYSKRAA